MTEEQRIKRIRAASTGCLFLTALIWGFAFVAQMSGTSTMGALTFNGVRFVLGALALIPVTLLFEKGKSDKKERRDTLLYGAAAGTVLCLAANLQQFGIDLTHSPARAGFITGLYMIVVPVAGIFLKRKTTVFTWIGALFALCGLYVLSTGESGGSVSKADMTKGQLFLLAGVVFWAAHILVVDGAGGKVRPLRFSMAQFWVCAIESLAVAAFTEDISVEGIMGGALPILYCGLLSVGVAYTLQVVGQRHVEPARASVIFSMETLFSALGEILLLHKFLPPVGYIGCALIFAGIIFAQLKPRQKAAKNF
ncbi:MAG: DMT family transporter [Clostridium sp.]|jgi:drug/metabolite transporter (DMT)-like permease|nr:DMT family transporter [Clostridium sp.]